MAQMAGAESLRLGFWNAELEREGPGLLLRDASQGDAQIAAVRQAIVALNADVLVLAGVDFDAEGLVLAAVNSGFANPYPYLLPLRPNTGVPTGFDLDGNGRRDEARDAQGFGTFPGQGGMALLSRAPISPEKGRDFSAFLWKDLPGAILPPLPDGAADVLRLSTAGHHETTLLLPGGQTLRLLSWHATTPAFDGPEDRNGKRNAYENRFWQLLLDGVLPFPPPASPFVLIGQANLDAEKGDGERGAMQRLLADPRLQDPLPGMDTVDYGGVIGRLRVAYILPSAGLRVTDAGVEPAPQGARHHPIWVQIDF